MQATSGGRGWTSRKNGRSRYSQAVAWIWGGWDVPCEPVLPSYSWDLGWLGGPRGAPRDVVLWVNSSAGDAQGGRHWTWYRGEIACLSGVLGESLGSLSGVLGESVPKVFLGRGRRLGRVFRESLGSPSGVLGKSGVAAWSRTLEHFNAREHEARETAA